MARKKAVRRTTPRARTAAGRAPKQTTKGATRGGRFVCPDCGFKAKHAMGLGRHRSARHGVVSKRAQMRRRSGRSISPRALRASADAAKAVRELEQRFEQLLSGLERLVAGARRSRRRAR